MAKPYIFIFDLETTGLGEKKERVAPVQIAGMVLDPNFDIVDTFQTFVKIPDGAHCEPYALDMHMKKGRDVAYFNTNGAHPQNAYLELKALLDHWVVQAGGKRIVPAGHNAARFDCNILVSEALHYNVKLPLDYHGGLDTGCMAIERFVYGDGSMEKVGLHLLCKRLGVAWDDTQAHDAIYDVAATAECLKAMMKGAARV